MRFFTSLKLFVSLLWFASLPALAQTDLSPGAFIDPRDTLRRQLDEERRRTIDPQLGTVPYDRLDQARQQVIASKKQPGSSTSQTGIPNITWQERGPDSFGDVRAVLADPNDPAKKKVWVGTATGGVWYTNDITSPTPSWVAVSNDWESQLVTALAADPSNTQVMYAGTGELNYTTGRGIWKTTNGGATWSRLSSTVPTGSYPSVGRAFEYIKRIVVSVNGDVLVASRYGVLRSTDGGASWQNILAPNQGIGFGSSTGNYSNDAVAGLELASDGIVYVSFMPGRVFKSTNAGATAWAEITPSPITVDRTEIAVSPSTSGAGQVLYAVARAYNNTTYNQDIKWFKKSVNAGSTWTDVSIPIIGTSDHFTQGNGYRYMTLIAHPTDANTVFAGGSGLFRSTNGGTSWTAITEASTGNALYSQFALQVVPGTNGVINAARQGIYWLADAANTAVTTPTAVARTSGLRTGAAYAVAMKNSPGSNYFLANIQPNGVVTMNAPGIGVVNSTIWGTGSTNILHIDTDEPNIQLLVGSSSFIIYNGSNTQSQYDVSYSGTLPSDYDSQNNTFYVYAYNSTNASHTIRRSTGVGSGTLNTTTIPLPAFTDQPTYLKLSSDRTALFIGGYGGKLYKLTGLNQATPVLTRVDNGAFGQVAVSCIDVGASDDELLVTFSNYGIQSVWYTSNGGNNWTGKDLLSQGLPDVPVWTGLFNPQNRQQVLLGTDLGVWTTNNITAANPEWTVSDGGLPLLRVNQLRYRPADGKLAAATIGRGIWTTDAFAIPYSLPTITLTGVSTTALCAGSVATVSFNTAGAVGATNQYEVWLSDKAGNFTNRVRVGTGTSSPVSFTLPGTYNGLPYGTAYQLKVIATNPEIESNPSAALSVGNLSYAYTYDRNNTSGSSRICTGSQATLSIRPRDYYGNEVAADQFQWMKDGVPIDGATAATYTATQTGVYSASVTQAGCAKKASDYSLAVGNSISIGTSASNYTYNQCVGSVVSVSALYAGDNASYQWLKDDVRIPGATSANYGVTQTGRYDVFIQDQSCSSTTNVSRYQFGSSIDVFIYGSAVDSLICSGASAGSYIYLNDASRFSAVQWYKNGVSIPGATNTYYYTSGAGAYSVMAQQGSCQTASNTLTRTVAQQIPVRIQYTGRTSLCTGESRTLYASSVTGSAYRWQLNGVDIPGATSSQYTVSSSGTYTVRDSVGRSCVAVSDPISFTFSNAAQPKITLGTVGATETCYSTYLYNYENWYGGNALSGYTYQWQRDGVNIDGAVSNSQSVNTTGLYTLRVTNGTCTGLSKGIYVRAGSSTPKPTIGYTNLEQCANNVVRLTANSANTSNYQWKRDGATLSGATYSTYYATQSGRYSVVVVAYGGCTNESDPVVVKIGEPTAATITGGALVNAGQTAYLPVLFSGPAPWSFTLSNGQAITAITQNPYMVPVAPSTTTTYSIASVANACGIGTSMGNAVVTVGSGSADLSLNMMVDNRTPTSYGMVSYSLVITNAGPQEATGVQIKSILPTGVSFLRAQTPAIRSEGSVVSIAAGTVPVGTTIYTFQTIVSGPGTLVTAAQITDSQTPDPDSQPNSGTGDGEDDTAQTDLRTPENGPVVVSPNPNQTPLPKVLSSQPAPSSSAVELSLQMTLNTLLVNVAQQEVVTATLTVRNRSLLTASGVVVRVALPNGAAAPATQTGWQAVDGQTLNGFFNSIPAGGSATIQLLWRPAGDGELKAQIVDVIEPTVGFTPGNGYAQGEKDESQVRVRSK